MQTIEVKNMAKYKTVEIEIKYAIFFVGYLMCFTVVGGVFLELMEIDGYRLLVHRLRSSPWVFSHSK